MKRILSLLLVVVMLLCTLTACAPKDDGAQIAVYISDVIYDLDPTDYYADKNAEQVMSLLYEPLFRISKKGKLECAAAKEYEVDEKTRTVVIELRESYWSNGQRVTAEDFIYAWRDRILEPNNQNPAAALFYDIENALAIKQGKESLYTFGAVRSDIYEITITYREGADVERLLYNLASVATAPVSQNSVSTAEDYWSKQPASTTTNGPFQVATYDIEAGNFTLTRNVGYHQKTTVKNYTKNVTPYTLYTFYSGDEAFGLSYSQIEDDVVFYMGNAPLAERAEYQKKATVADALSTYAYVFNTANPLFADANVRLALSLVIDRAAIAEALTFGTPATSLIAGSKTETVISTSAKKALAEEALAKASLTGIQKAFTLTVENDEESLKIAELVKSAWESLGFTVTVKPVDAIHTVLDTNTGKTALDKNGDPITAATKENHVAISDDAIQAAVKAAAAGNADFDVLAIDVPMYSIDPFVALAAFTSEMNGNGVDFATETYRTHISGFTNAEYDALLEAAYRRSGTARENALADAEKLLMEQSPIVPIIYNQNFAFTHRHLKGVKADGLGNFSFTEASLRKYKKYLPGKEE